MGSLLPDESFCKSELGSLVYKSRKYYGFNPEIEEVKEPLSFFGHVEYTIRITVD
jgi:hypothetical protein